MGHDRDVGIVGFLLARIAEDEQETRHLGLTAFTGTGAWALMDSAAAYEWTQATVLAHCRRTLDECAAKRRIIALHASIDAAAWSPGSRCAECSVPTAFPCRTILALAKVYAEHPSYRDEWRP